MISLIPLTSGTEVITVTAIDEDPPTSANGVVRYRIIDSPNNADDAFDIDGSTGTITVAPGTVFDFDTIDQYTLNVSVERESKKKYNKFMINQKISNF